jgi:hypothetical protein
VSTLLIYIIQSVSWDFINSLQTKWSQSYLTTDGQSAILSWCQATICDSDQSFFSSLSKSYFDSCAVVVMGLPLWGEVGSLVYSHCWTSPAQCFSGQISVKLAMKFRLTYTLTQQLKLKLICDRQSVGQPVLVSDTHLGPAINFSFSLKFPSDSCGFIIL